MTTNRAPQIGAQLQTRSRTAHRGIGGAHLHGQSSDVPALFAEALKLFQAGHLSEAEEILHCILEVQAQHFDALHLLGVVLSQQGNHTEGLRFLDVALQTENTSSALQNSRGNLLVALKRFDEALIAFEKAVAFDPKSPIAFANRGNVLRELGRSEEAVASYDHAIVLDPSDAEAFYNRSGALQDLKRLDQAVASYDKAIAIKADYAEAWSNRGTALQELGRFGEAIVSYDKAIALKPNFPEALCNRGGVLKKMKRFDEAITSVDKAIALKRDLPEAWNCRGASLQALGRFEEAVASYGEAIACNSNYVEAFSNRGHALRTLGRLEESVADFEQALALAPRHIDCLYNLATARRVKAADPYFAAAKDLARDLRPLEIEDQIKLHFTLGKSFDDVGEPDQSFHHLVQGNALRRGQMTYNEAAMLQRFERIRNVFTPELLHEKRGLGAPTTVPVFIVGMPRSGTTLIEQILVSHPRVFGAGERQEFSEGVAKIRAPNGQGYPEAVPTLPSEQLRRLGQTYLNSVQSMAPRAERITDKMPENFRFLGLIHLALPNAHIIHASRDPRDVALSCFSIDFAEDHLPFTYDLSELGRYIRAYQVLMEHWRKVLPARVILNVQYEELVEDLEKGARRIVAHCGLEWDDACLDFHRTERVVQTASATQVRRPIYRTSVGRWREYGDLLKPLLEVLGEP